MVSVQKYSSVRSSCLTSVVFLKRDITTKLIKILSWSNFNVCILLMQYWILNKVFWHSYVWLQYLSKLFCYLVEGRLFCESLEINLTWWQTSRLTILKGCENPLTTFLVVDFVGFRLSFLYIVRSRVCLVLFSYTFVSLIFWNSPYLLVGLGYFGPSSVLAVLFFLGFQISYWWLGLLQYISRMFAKNFSLFFW